jgi:lauroyl/myristoyl acyltransferase
MLHKVIRDEVFIQDPECSLKILQRLRRGGIVEINLDVTLSRHQISRPFLGRHLIFSAGAMHLAKLSGCALLPKLALGNADSFEIRIGPPFYTDFNLPLKDFCETHMSSIIAVLESHAMENPDQWELLVRL